MKRYRLETNKSCDSMYSATLICVTPSQKTTWMQKVLWVQKRTVQGELCNVTKQRTI